MIRIHQEQGANVVFGHRTKRKGESSRKSRQTFLSFPQQALGGPLPLDTGDFRLIDRKVMDAFCQFTEKNKYIRGIISWLGFSQAPIHYVREERFAGETKYPFRKMIKFATTGLLYFTKKPLKLAMHLGLFCVLVGLGMAAWVVWLHLSGDASVAKVGRPCSSPSSFSEACSF